MTRDIHDTKQKLEEARQKESQDKIDRENKNKKLIKQEQFRTFKEVISKAMQPIPKEDAPLPRADESRQGLPRTEAGEIDYDSFDYDALIGTQFKHQ